MADLILNSAQTEVVRQARDEVYFCDAAGNVLGVLVRTPTASPPDSDVTDEQSSPGE